MFISATAVTVLMWVGIAAAALVALVAAVRGVRWYVVLGGLAAVTVAIGPRTWSTHVVVVREVVDGLVARQYHMLGTREYRFVDGQATRVASSKTSMVVNDTNIPLELQTLYYGPLRLPRVNDTIATRSVKAVGRTIDHLGPVDVPPESVTMPRGVGLAMRTWLTW